MKVLQINAIYGGSSTGRTTYEMDIYLKEQGIDSFSVSSVPNEKYNDIYIIGDKSEHKIHSLLSRITGKQGYFSKRTTKKLLNYMDKVKPDIVHLRNLHGNYINLNMLLKYLGDNNIATVITLHDCWFFTGKCCHYLQDNCYKWKDICNNCPALHKFNNSYFFDFSKQMQKDKQYYFNRIKKIGIVGVSYWITNECKQSSVFKNSNAIFKTIYNWIDLEKFYPKEQLKLKEKYNLSDKFIILGVSHGWKNEKGLDIFVELGKLISNDCQILLVGNCNENIDNEKIKCVGAINDVNTLVDYYSLSDVYLNPSIQETFGKTTAEAMACGTPAIGCNTTATPELIGNDEKCGYILDNRTAEEYYNKIKIIKEKGKDYYSKNCREKVINNFDKNINIEKYINIYNELLN